MYAMLYDHDDDTYRPDDRFVGLCTARARTVHNVCTDRAQCVHRLCTPPQFVISHAHGVHTCARIRFMTLCVLGQACLPVITKFSYLRV